MKRVFLVNLPVQRLLLLLLFAVLSLLVRVPQVFADQLIVEGPQGLVRFSQEVEGATTVVVELKSRSAKAGKKQAPRLQSKDNRALPALEGVVRSELLTFEKVPAGRWRLSKGQGYKIQAVRAR